MRIIRWIAISIGVLLAGLVGTLAFIFGGGAAYPDLSGVPSLKAADLEIAVTSSDPIGNVAVAADGRIFTTVHPEANWRGPKLFVWQNGKGVPYPAGGTHGGIFDSPLGLRIDSRNRLWVIDPATHGTKTARLIAFDLATNTEVARIDFPSSVAPLGSFLQDFAIDPEAEMAYIADVGFFARRPALVIVDLKTKAARRVLQRHAALSSQNWLVRNPIRTMSYFGGLIKMKTGIDGVTVSRDGAWLYFASMTHDTLFRISTADLKNPALSDTQLALKLQPVSKKPLSDGITSDIAGNIFVTDVEHGAVIRVTPDGKLNTVVKDARIRWADGLSFGPDGWLYLADSAIPTLVFNNHDNIRKAAPFYVFRFKPGTSAAPGQ